MIKINIQTLRDTEISRITEIHKTSLPEDFLPSLGSDFLINVFYPAILASQNAKIFIANINKTTVGFIVISSNSNLLLRDIVLYRFFLFLYYLIRSALLSFKQLKMILGIFLTSFHSHGEIDLGEIYIIAVDQNYRGCGIGKLLVNKSIEYLKEQSSPGIKIKTLKTNYLWISFFEKNDWKISAEFNTADKDYVILSKRF